ncbi:hypothetical protein CDAR_402521 [Caerostris darwini]|uniref:Uncharacterized protein n=1 Tax=Caerostris darwini TaxID=1538125 RepID=A0AAV4RST4_9ARAC|nr:hypothetical protein CDAR_402521 [Caerostris darwini]
MSSSAHLRDPVLQTATVTANSDVLRSHIGIVQIAYAQRITCPSENLYPFRCCSLMSKVCKSKCKIACSRPDKYPQGPMILFSQKSKESAFHALLCAVVLYFR